MTLCCQARKLLARKDLHDVPDIQLYNDAEYRDHEALNDPLNQTDTNTAGDYRKNNNTQELLVYTNTTVS